MLEKIMIAVFVVFFVGAALLAVVVSRNNDSWGFVEVIDGVSEYEIQQN